MAFRADPATTISFVISPVKGVGFTRTRKERAVEGAVHSIVTCPSATRRAVISGAANLLPAAIINVPADRWPEMTVPPLYSPLTGGINCQHIDRFAAVPGGRLRKHPSGLSPFHVGGPDTSMKLAVPAVVAGSYMNVAPISPASRSKYVPPLTLNGPARPTQPRTW